MPHIEGNKRPFAPEVYVILPGFGFVPYAVPFVEDKVEFLRAKYSRKMIGQQSFNTIGMIPLIISVKGRYLIVGCAQYNSLPFPVVLAAAVGKAPVNYKLKVRTVGYSHSGYC